MFDWKFFFRNKNCASSSFSLFPSSNMSKIISFILMYWGLMLVLLSRFFRSICYFKCQTFLCSNFDCMRNTSMAKQIDENAYKTKHTWINLHNRNNFKRFQHPCKKIIEHSRKKEKNQVTFVQLFQRFDLFSKRFFYHFIFRVIKTFCVFFHCTSVYFHIKATPFSIPAKILQLFA